MSSSWDKRHYLNDKCSVRLFGSVRMVALRFEVEVPTSCVLSLSCDEIKST